MHRRAGNLCTGGPPCERAPRRLKASGAPMYFPQPGNPPRSSVQHRHDGIYRHPDLLAAALRHGSRGPLGARARRTACFPKRFFSTTNLPTYVKIGGRVDGCRATRAWTRPWCSTRTACPASWRAATSARGSRWRSGSRRTGARGSTSTPPASWGDDEVGPEGEFKFMSSEVSREKPTDYAEMARVLVDERERGGYIVWVRGPGGAPLARPRHDGVVHRERLRGRAASAATRWRCTTSRRPCWAPRWG